MPYAHAMSSLQQGSEGFSVHKKRKQGVKIIGASSTHLRTRLQKKQAELSLVQRASPVPDDVLSLIFIEYCSEDWKGPLVLGSICRHWRAVLIATPRAWAFIQIAPGRVFHHELAEIWLSRCGAIKIDFNLHPLSPPALVKTISNHEKNIRALSLFAHSKRLKQEFSQLEELRLGDAAYISGITEYTGIPFTVLGPDIILHMWEEIANIMLDEKGTSSVLDVKRYPKLRSLHLHGRTDPLLESIALAKGFPPLQELHVQFDQPCVIDLIQLCSQTLVKLGFRFIGLEKEDEWSDESINLPLLTHLSYIYISGHSSNAKRFPAFITPNLESYHEWQPNSNYVLHQHTMSVKTLLVHSERTIKWNQFPRLTHLTLRRYMVPLINDCQYLKDNPQVCPRLESVRYISPGAVNLADSREAERHFVERSVQANKRIDFKYISENEIEGRDQVEYTNCYTYCSAHGDIEDVYEEYPDRF